MNAVAVRVAGGQQIGYLAADVAKWVSPWLESGEVDFKCRIKSVEPFESDDGRTMLGAEITMTRLELVPGDPRFVALAKVAALPFVAVVRATAVAEPAMRVVFGEARACVASICHRVVVGSRTLAPPTVAAVLAGLKKIDSGLATLAEGNPVMLNVFRVTAAVAVSAAAFGRAAVARLTLRWIGMENDGDDRYRDEQDSRRLKHETHCFQRGLGETG